MRRSVKIKWGSVPVGVIIMLAVAILMYSSMTGGGTSIFESKITFICYFSDVNGLVRGSPVWMSGLEVGNVITLEFGELSGDRPLKVTCRVTKKVHRYLNEETRVELRTIGFLGDKYIEIIPGLTGRQPIADRDVIEANDVGSATDMFEAGEAAFGGAGALVSSLDTFLVRMNDGQGTFGKLATDEALYTQLTTLMSNLAKLTADLQKNQEALISSVQHMSQSVGDLASKVNENQGTLGKLITDPELYNNLNATSARFDSILTKIDMADGNLGLLVNDTGLYVELTNLLVRANALITDIEKNPRDYFKFSVF